MNICLLNAQVPFARGGAEHLADSLARRLAGLGHRVECVNVPFKWYPAAAVAPQVLACRLLRLGACDPDLTIGLKFPAYLVPCARKKVWLLHQFRQVYDLWGAPGSDPGLDSPEGRWLRELVCRVDNDHLRSTQGLYTISANVAGRLRRFNGIEADGVLYPPLDRPELFRPGESGDYFFYPSRLGPLKRQDLAIRAMRLTRSPFSLVIAGVPDEQSYLDQLEALVRRHGLQGRVRLVGRVSEEEKAEWLAGCLGVVFVPQDEDYGYVTVEAFQAHKPVVTCADSGGPTELVVDGESGRVCEPRPEALAEALEGLWADRARARRMGAAGRAALDRLGIAWPHVLERLTA